MKKNTGADDESSKTLLGSDSAQTLQKLSSSIKEQLRALEDAPDELEAKFKGMNIGTASENSEEVLAALGQLYSGYCSQISNLGHLITSAEASVPSLTANKMYWEKMLEKYMNEKKSIETCLNKKYRMMSQKLKEKLDQYEVLGGNKEEPRERGHTASNLMEQSTVITESSRLTREALQTGNRTLESFMRQNEYMMVDLMHDRVEHQKPLTQHQGRPRQERIDGNSDQAQRWSRQPVDSGSIHPDAGGGPVLLLLRPQVGARIDGTTGSRSTPWVHR